MNVHSRVVSRCSKALAIFLLVGISSVFAQSRQEHVHQRAHHVMPFDIDRTLHIFRMTESGGVQKVIAKDSGANDQIALIQQHLRHEAGRFQVGDYSDPAALHGAGMPGLRELRAGAPDIRVSYAALPLGAEITFETNDLRLITAVHRWFGAQLSEHGANAKAE